MEDCELCGRQTRDIYVVEVENVELRTCTSCAKGKKVVRTEMESNSKGKQISRPIRIKEEDRPLIDDYGQAIKEARERMKLPIKVLGEMISEKEHLLARVEEEKTKPTIALTKKLEKVLKIKLTEEPQEQEHYVAKKTQNATLGDFIE